MEVLSESSAHVSEARSAVQELLLLNHPVDCPICDQAGECRLQDYWLEHQSKKKRMRDEPIHKPKGVVFGPTIVYDAERCIICTRCVRVCEELAQDPVLSVRERGNLDEIVVAPGRELDHPYTLMTEYVCPVGALTARDFRFKARVWFLRSARSVCVGCATGCNAFTDYDPRTQQVYRYRPRENLNVNKYWMCDEGMLDYRRVHERRVLEARFKGKPVVLESALRKAAKALKNIDPEKLAIVLSAQHSNEDNFALLTLARNFIGAGNLFVSGRAAGQGDDILRHADKNPNSAGVTALCTTTPPQTFSELLTAISQGVFTHVLCLGSLMGDAEDHGSLARTTLSKAMIIALATHEGTLVDEAHVVLPVSSFAECDGTFVNARGLAQESEQAIAPLGDSQPGWLMVAMLGQSLGHDVGFWKLKQVRAAMAPEAGATLSKPGSAGAGAMA